jgi:hypothetical protein
MRHVPPGLDELTARAYDLVTAGELARARAVLEDGLAEAEFDGSTVPPDLAEAASLYARVLLACGEPEPAREWAAYAHGAAERLHGADDERTVRDQATLAAALYRVGDLPAAEQLYREVVTRLSAQVGAGSPNTLAARADLATVLHATGQCRAARAELAGALAAHQAGYGVQEPAGIRMLARLAAMSRDCGDEEAAERHFSRARALAETYLPADHPVLTQVCALGAAPPNGAHPCELVAPAPDDDSQWWPPEQDEEGEAGDFGPPPEAEPLPHVVPVPEGGSWAFQPPHLAEEPPPSHPEPPLPHPEPPAQRSAPPPRHADNGWVERDTRPPEGRVSRGHLAAPRRMPGGHAVPDQQGRAGSGFPAVSTVTVAAPYPAAPAPRPGTDLAYVGRPAPEASRSRWAGIAFGTGLALLGVAGGWFAANTLINGAGASESPAAAPTTAPVASVSPRPPAGVLLRDGWDSVTLSWEYPGGAEGPVLVAGGRTGEQQRAFQTLAPGTNSYTVYGLAERADYCFTVAVVYSTDTVARSAPVCTARSPGKSPSPR